MLKKTVIFILCIILVTLSSTACQSNESNSGKPVAAKAGQPTTSGQSAVTDPLANDPGKLPIVKEPVTLSLGLPQDPNVIKFEDNWQTQYLEEKTGVKIKFELFPGTADEAKQKMQLMISSNTKLPDMFYGMGLSDASFCSRNGSAGVLIDLSKYYETLGYNYREGCAREGFDPNKLLSYMRGSDGKIYTTFYVAASLANEYCYRAWMNQRWLDKLGLKQPTTSDELATVLKAFRDNDPNGNGKKDEIPMCGGGTGLAVNPIRYIMNMFIYSNSSEDYYLPLNKTGGKLDVAYDKNEFRESLRFSKMLVDEGLLSLLFFTQNSSQWSAMASASPQILGLGVSNTISTFSKNIPDYEPLGTLKGPNGVQWATANVGAAIPTASMAVTKDCKHPEIAFMWMTYGYGDKMYTLAQRWGEPKVDWREPKPEEISFYDDLGLKPDVYQINQIWGTPQNKNFQLVTVPFLASTKSRVLVGEKSESNSEYKNAKSVKKNMGYAPKFEDVVNKIIYSDEELDKLTDMKIALRGYINESIAKFAIGQMNIDRDWNTYLQGLERLKYKDILAADQIAFDRTRGR